MNELQTIQNPILNLSIVLKSDRNQEALADGSRKLYLETGKAFNQFIEETGLPIDVAVISFLEKIKKEDKPTTFNRKYYSLRKLFLAQPGIANDVERIKTIKEGFLQVKKFKTDELKAVKPATDCLSFFEIQKLMAYRKKWIALIFEFLFKSGCRISEAINIEFEKSIKPIADGKVEITVIGKGSKPRLIYLQHDLINRIKKQFKGEKYLFETRNHTQFSRFDIYNTVRRVGYEVLKRDIHPHTMRHSTATFLMIEQKQSPNLVADFLGHSDPSTTLKMYVHDKNKPEIADLFEVKPLR